MDAFGSGHGENFGGGLRLVLRLFICLGRNLHPFTGKGVDPGFGQLAGLLDGIVLAGRDDLITARTLKALSTELPFFTWY